MSAHRRRRQRIVRALWHLRDRRVGRGADAGSVLLEAIVVMIVVTVVMVAVIGVLITGSQTTTKQRNAQRAVHLAITAMDTAQALGSAADHGPRRARRRPEGPRRDRRAAQGRLEQFWLRC